MRVCYTQGGGTVPSSIFRPYRRTEDAIAVWKVEHISRRKLLALGSAGIALGLAEAGAVVDVTARGTDALDALAARARAARCVCVWGSFSGS